MMRWPMMSILSAEVSEHRSDGDAVDSLKSITSRANVIEILNPYASRTRTSRPRSSVPNGCSREGAFGGDSLRSRSDSFGPVRVRRHQHPVPLSRFGEPFLQFSIVWLSESLHAELGHAVEIEHREEELALISDEQWCAVMRIGSKNETMYADRIRERVVATLQASELAKSLPEDGLDRPGFI